MEHRLAELLDAHGPGLHALLLRITLRRDVAAELFQELFARLAGSNGFASADDYPAFAYRTAINLAHDWRRRRRRTPATRPLPDELPESRLPIEALDREELALVLDAVARLNQPARDAICLRYLQQMSYAEIAGVIGRSAHQARALCYAGIVRVRRTLSEEGRVNRVIPRRG